MAEYRHAFERLDAVHLSERFVFLTSEEFEIFFSGIDAPKARKALAWDEFKHSVGGRMIKTDMSRAQKIVESVETGDGQKD